RPQEKMSPIICSRAKDKVDPGGHQHAKGDVLSGIAVVGKVAHYKLADPVSHSGTGQNIADHGLVVLKRGADLLGHGSEVIADQVERGIGDKGGLENAP